MTQSTLTLGSEEIREALYTQIARKISIFNTVLATDKLAKDGHDDIKILIKEATRYKNFLARKNSIITLTIDDIGKIDKILDFKV